MAEPPQPDGLPLGLPPRSSGTVRVDSVEEEHAYLAAYRSPGGGWRVVSQTLGRSDDAPIDRLRLRARESGDEGEVLFAIESFFGTPGLARLGTLTTAFLDRLMRIAEEFARANGAHHPGSLPRFPVPSARYPGRVDVPMAVLATEGGRRGLYAPPRVVTVDYATGEPYGVGEFPGFAPEDWPPSRLGDWPPPGLGGIDRVRLQGLVGRFSACVTRLIDAWSAGQEYPHLGDDAREAWTLLGVLDLREMLPSYRTLNPDYVAWWERRAETV